MTRDVTAWACQFACASRPLVSGRCFKQMTPGLGPPRPTQHELVFRPHSYRRLPRFVLATAHPNGVAKRFPDWTAVGFRASYTPPINQLAPMDRIHVTSRTLREVRALLGGVRTLLFPRIACPSRPFLAHLRHAGSDASLVGGLSPRGATFVSTASCYATVTNLMHHLRRS